MVFRFIRELLRIVLLSSSLLLISGLGRVRQPQMIHRLECQAIDHRPFGKVNHQKGTQAFC